MGGSSNRITSTNFEFLKLDWDLQKEYYGRSKYIEDFFVSGDYTSVVEQADKFEEELLKKNIISEKVMEYSTGNIKSDALNRLKKIHQIVKEEAIKYGKKINTSFVNPIEQKQYQTNERKLIYVQTADNSSGNWGIYAGSQKVGDATADNNTNPLDFQPNSDYLRKEASNRIKSYMITSGVSFRIDWAELAYRPEDKLNPWFRDHDVHEVLRRSNYEKNTELEGNEWWKISLKVAKEAIAAVKENREVIDGPIIDKSIINLRPEQKDAVAKTKKVFKSKDRMLWNAKMRFGKTLTTYQLIKEEKYKSVLILTHRPVVSDSWYEDFEKMQMREEGYSYGSKKGESIESLTKNREKFVYFASMQDLRGSNQVGGKQGEKNETVFSTNWDLIVFDEAHEGTQTELAQNVEQAVKKEKTKILELSGTPLNLLENYPEEQVFTWDYTMEQEEKLRWSIEKPNEPNPYETLPRMNMFIFEMHNKEKYEDINKAFNFKEFFRIKEDNLFEHESDINVFLNEITKKSNTNYPYSTEEFRNELRHSLWLLPGVAEAKALKTLMDKHPIFGKEYKIINIVDNNDNQEASKDDLERVRSAITDKPWETKTITLTVRKLTTGVNVKEWTAVMFLNNTNSAMNYLQAAFRAQTPYSNEVQGQKTNAYIFDFAPDRALTVMAESASLNSGVGKRNTPEQKQKMSKMLNFLPILGLEGNEMRPFKVDKMLTQLKKVYAEKAVRSGFDDDSLYSDALLTITPEAAELFEKLKGIMGKTGASKGVKEVKINEQGLTDEEYEQAEIGKKKSTKERTKDEKAAIEKLNEAKKERKNAISILRGISIRIPLMIFGMEVDISKDIDIYTFVNEVDDISWAEFMPAGVTKEMFREQAKYYDPEVFIEAGRIIRSRAKSYDELNYMERAEQIAQLHGTFKNPDKETVLTPWRVVNMQLVSSIGGLSFYNEDFNNITKDGKSALRWVEQENTDEVYKNSSKILDINAKTGLYPLLVATSFFYKQQMKFIEENVGVISRWDEEKIIQDVLANNIYVIAKTPMAKTITQRTLAGYKNWKTNISYIPDIVKEIKEDLDKTVEKVQKSFGGKIMKFDVVVGNPPYQESREDTLDYAVYNYFYDLSEKISDKYCLISPARFLFNAGSTDKNWNQKMLQDKHVKVVYFNQKSAEIFPNTDIKGGVAIIYRDIKQNFGKIGIFTSFEELNSIIHKVVPLTHATLDTIITGQGIYRFTQKAHENHPEVSSILPASHQFDISTGVFGTLDNILFFEKKPDDGEEYISMLGRYKNERVYRWIRKDYVNEPSGFDKWKVILPNANGSGAIGEVLSTPLIGNPLIGNPLIGFTQTFLSVGRYETQLEAENTMKYIKSKFARAMLGVLKITQHNPAAKWKFVPLQDFTEKSDIDWTQSIPDIDRQLYKKYNLDETEIAFIEEKVRAME